MQRTNINRIPHIQPTVLLHRHLTDTTGLRTVFSTDIKLVIDVPLCLQAGTAPVIPDGNHAHGITTTGIGIAAHIGIISLGVGAGLDRK